MRKEIYIENSFFVEEIKTTGTKSPCMTSLKEKLCTTWKDISKEGHIKGKQKLLDIKGGT